MSFEISVVTLPLGAIWAVAAYAGCGTTPSSAAPPADTNRAEPVATEASTARPQSSSADAPRVSEQPSASSSASPPAAEPPPCPPDMVDIGRACIDRYEAPNQQGVAPLVMVTADEAVAWCAERGKRLCSEDEWLRACQGPSGARYPYGASYQEHHCNHDKNYRVPRWGVLAKWPAAAATAENDRLNQSEPAGTRSTCGSKEGVFDLTGNVAEWVVKIHDHPEACKSGEERGHTYVAQGCSWVKCYREPHEPACDYVNCAHASGFRSYETGFRCCRDRKE
jgi:Sulfatase-modifying factor enzyme 1